MKNTLLFLLPLLTYFALLTGPALCADLPHAIQTWVKRHPQEKPPQPPPRMGYETSYGYDPLRQKFIRYGGHNQGGGGEQNSEVWIYDLEKDHWELKQPNTAPPGVCCAQQNVFHDALGKFVRFPAFSASHGWQFIREVNLKNNSVWTYDLGTDRWLNLRPVPEPPLRPLRGAAYDPHHEVIVIHGGEGARHSTVVYDLYTNTWYEMNPKNAPPTSLSQPGFTYDPVNRVFVLFGSQFSSHRDTWVYDLRKNEWRVLDTAARPPFEKSSPILAADSRNGIVLASVQGQDGLETWALDVAKETWKKLDVKYDPDTKYEGSAGNRNRVLLYVPDKNLFFMENRVRKEQQIWTFRYAESSQPLPSARGVQVVIKPDGKSAQLTWKQPQGKGPFVYNVYRGDGAKSWEVQWQPLARGLKELSYIDDKVKPETIAWYRVHAVLDGKEGPGSNLARTQPPIVQQLHVSVLKPAEVEIAWNNVSADDVAGYHVERAPVMVYSTDEVKSIKNRLQPTSDLAAGSIRRIGAFQRLTEKPIVQTRFVDKSVDLQSGQVGSIDKPLWQRDLRPDQLEADGKPYRFAVFAYRIRAVNRSGVVSGPSPVRFTIPSIVEYPFSKEEGASATRLKWQANPEKNITGYLVYRHDGRFNKSPIVRLTPKPITETTFFDENAGKGTRRYEIVAVDALGQEGIPSRPVWSRREWQQYYVPYTKEWHQ